MANIRDLTEATTISGGDLFPIAQGSSGRTRSVSYSVIKDDVTATVSSEVAVAVAAAEAAEEAAASADATILRQELLDPVTPGDGSSLVAYETGVSVRDKLDALDQLDTDLQNPTDPTKGAAIVGRGVVAVDSIADLLALPESARRGDLRYEVASYYGGWAVEEPYLGPRGGGEFIWSPEDVRAANEGTIFSAPAVATGRFVRNVSKWTLRSFWFGAKGNGVDDDAPALNKMFAAQAQFNEPLVSGIGLSSEVIFDKAHYAIGSTVVNSGSYGDVDYSWSYFTPTASFNQSTFAFDFTYNYTSTFLNLKMGKFDFAIRTANPNLGTGQIVFDGLHMHDVGVALDIDQRSSYTLIDNYKFVGVKHPGVIRSGDNVRYAKGWFKPGVLDNPYEGFWQILPDSFSPGLVVDACFYNPTPQTALDVVVIEARDVCRIDVDAGLFGGEDGQVPLIGWHADAENRGNGRGSVIRVRNTQFIMAQQPPSNDPTGRRAWVELYGLPTSITFDNVTGLVDGIRSRGLVYFREDFQTFEEAEIAAVGSSTTINFFGEAGFNGVAGTWVVDKKLIKFVTTRPRISYGQKAVNNSSVPADALQVVINNESRKNGGAYRLTAKTRSSSGDTYSEYIIGLSTATVPAISWISVIKQGGSTLAPLAFIDSGNLYLRLNGGISATDVFYSIEKLASPLVG